VLTTSANGQARLWASRVQAELELVTTVPGPVATASFSADGRVAAVADRVGTEVLSASTGERIALLRTGRVHSLALSGDGSLVAVADRRHVAIWQVESAQLADGVETGGTTTALALSPDGLRLAVGTAAGAVRVRTMADSRDAELEASGPGVASIAFSSSGDRLLAGLTDGTIAAWSTSDGRRLYRRLEHRPGSPVTAVAFSAGDRRLVTAGADSTVRVWDAASGRPLYALRGHLGRVGDAAFSADGRWVATAGPNTAGLWDLASRQRLLFLPGHESRVLAASFDPAGRTITTVGADGTLRSFRCEVCGGVADLLRLAERRLAAVGRELTAAERRLYLGEG
jgi:WD40 repeat protein